MRQTFSFVLICLTVVLSQNSFAQATTLGGDFYVEETFFPVYVQKNDAESYAGGSVSKSVPTEAGLGYDLRTTFGYVAWTDILFALTFNYYHVGTSRPRTSDYEGLTTNTDKQEFGPTVGYLWGSWRFLATYLVWAQKNYSEKYTDPTTGAVSTENNYKNTGGSGYQLAVSYGLNLGGSLTIGPTLIYREVTYAKQSLASPTGTSSYGSTSTSSPGTPPIDAQLQPMITVVYRF